MKSSGDEFPTLAPKQIDTDEVVAYLSELNANGHRVFRDPKQSNVFYIELNDDYRIRISASGGRSQVQLHYLGNITDYLDASSLSDVDKAIGKLVRAKVSGMNWPYRPTSGRVSAQEPATNYSTISKLIGTSQVEAIFDPYLTNGGLEELRAILSFGEGSVADGVRLLGSTATTTGGNAKFTKHGVDSWLHQIGITGDARVLPARSEHRRFLLLSSGQSLLLGHSLNAIHKNEAIRLEFDSEDRPFFDTCWSAAKPLV